MITITPQNLYPCFNAGTPNNKQLAMFGMKWPLRNGWAKEMLGREVTDDFLVKLAGLRKGQANKHQPQSSLLLDAHSFLRLHPQPNGEFVITYSHNSLLTNEALDNLAKAIKYTRKHTLA